MAAMSIQYMYLTAVQRAKNDKSNQKHGLFIGL